jgi:SAM-dependent methyltransferase
MKQGEIDYMQNLGEEGATDAYDKPFSHFTCSKNLVDLGVIMALLPPPPARLLDLGCGTGWTSAFFARRGYRVTGQDIAPDMIQYAERNRARYEAQNLDFVISDYESMAFDEPFDCAVFYDSLHHAVDERAALEGVFRVLRPGGVLITHEPGAGHSKSEESIRAMQLYSVTEKDMPPHHIRDLCMQIGYTGFEFLIDPTLAMIAVYGLNLNTTGRNHRPWWRRPITLARLLRDRTLETGGLCVITK